MATSPIQSTTGLQSIAETLTKQFDTDGDGRLSSQEFTSVLTRALSQSTTIQSLPKSGGSATAQSAGSGSDTPRTRINQILSAYPDTASGLSRALPELLSAILGIRLTDTGLSGAGSTPPPSVAASPLVSGAPYTGFSPNYPFEGFNFAREQNPGKSAKDAFALLANQAPPAPFLSKDGIGSWFTANVQPGMEQLGHRINWVSGDKFNFTNWQGTFNVDFVRGAGAPGAAFAWQAENA